MQAICYADVSLMIGADKEPAASIAATFQHGMQSMLMVQAIPGVSMRILSPAWSSRVTFPPMLMQRSAPSSWRIKKFFPARAGWPPHKPKGLVALRSDSMHAVMGRRNSTCSIIQGLNQTLVKHLTYSIPDRPVSRYEKLCGAGVNAIANPKVVKWPTWM